MLFFYANNVVSIKCKYSMKYEEEVLILLKTVH